MRNSMTMSTLNLTRLETCDLLLACLAARDEANDGGEKWQRLHDKIKAQLDEFDAQLDELIKDETRY